MSKIKYLLLFAPFVAIGFLAYSYRATILSSLSGGIQPIIATVQPTVTQIQTAWSNLPEVVRGVVLLGIPTAFATFFAWTKSRAMQKLQQTQLQAAQQVSGLNTQMQSLMDERDTTIRNLEQQITSLKESNSDPLRQSLAESQALVTSYKQQIDKQQAIINDLHRQIEQMKLKVHETVVVK